MLTFCVFFIDIVILQKRFASVCWSDTTNYKASSND